MFAILELRKIGSAVVAAKVSTSLHLCRCDALEVSERILRTLLPACRDLHLLLDGTFIYLSNGKDLSCVSDILMSDDSLPDFSFRLQLEDGDLHDVIVSLRQSVDPRNDYWVGDTRYIYLRGNVSVEVDGEPDDTIEE